MTPELSDEEIGIRSPERRLLPSDGRPPYGTTPPSAAGPLSREETPSSAARSGVAVRNRRRRRNTVRMQPGLPALRGDLISDLRRNVRAADPAGLLRVRSAGRLSDAPERGASVLAAVSVPISS
eukprot:CAMPEP_0113300920 /NCGR_PEP_ID=MMETSP0010_2-20120614/2350_1 /TAXON_ID=216773 ORGANISM="Corethron hystrix, Strain 308" /NCGR_SAMPLE_ID=MMETSP0010_2 /ASSEMBLY_ACC=CAM_ASM_000155 /LENGTH=123 /DNA_ID=CAMNT_0000154427 /DNA_START=112 /DNA_END=483 /DNA_ORIENTATION=+ /assembly_acc=CAM_ASM_000155